MSNESQIVGEINESLDKDGMSVSSRVGVAVSQDQAAGADETYKSVDAGRPVDADCAFSPCKEARSLGLAMYVAQRINSYGLLAYKADVPSQDVLEFTTQLQVDAIHALDFLHVDKWVEIAKKVTDSEEVEVLNLLEPGSIPVKAIEAGAPIKIAPQFELKTQVDAIPLFRRGVETALKFVTEEQLAAVKDPRNISVKMALRATKPGVLAWKSGIPYACAWKITNGHQIKAYQMLKKRVLTVDICATSLLFGGAKRYRPLEVLRETGNLPLAIALYNPYAQRAYDANITPSTVVLINNEYSLAAVVNHSVTGNLTANFTDWYQVWALEKNMSHEEAARITVGQVRWKMGFWGNYEEFCAWSGMPYYTLHTLVAGVIITGGTYAVLFACGVAISSKKVEAMSVSSSVSRSSKGLWSKFATSVSRWIPGHAKRDAAQAAATKVATDVASAAAQRGVAERQIVRVQVEEGAVSVRQTGSLQQPSADILLSRGSANLPGSPSSRLMAGAGSRRGSGLPQSAPSSTPSSPRTAAALSVHAPQAPLIVNRVDGQPTAQGALPTGPHGASTVGLPCGFGLPAQANAADDSDVHSVLSSGSTMHTLDLASSMTLPSVLLDQDVT